MMTSRKEKAERLFLALRASEPAQRSALLDQWCAGDPELRHEVEDKLDWDGLEKDRLEGDERLGSFMEEPPLDFLRRAMEDAATVTEESRSVDEQQAKLTEGRLANGLVLNKRFVIVRFIAKGGMGEVYEAEDSLLHGTHIALKTILPEIADEPGLQLRFEHEVLAAREVVHPNLCPIYHIERCDVPPPGFLFLTMKLLPGETLGARLRRSGRLPREEGLSITRQMADGLAAIHAAGIVHRDIKATNVMLDGSGSDIRLWITDFGLARALQADPSFSGRTILAGTPGYIAPELYRGQPASRASDLFAFGVLLHEAFTGARPPEKGDSPPVTPGARLSAAGVPSVCAELIKGCIDENPARRCAAFDQGLEAFGLKRQEKKKWTRRQFAGMAAVAACSFTAAGWFERDPLYNMAHPLPQKRFVALLPWPKTSDSDVAPMLTGVLSAIKGELSRLEAFDRNLFVISPEDVNQGLTDAPHLKDVCDPLGANLALAASGRSGNGDFHLNLRLLDPVTTHPVRQTRLTCALRDITGLPARAVDAAASLLNMARYLRVRAKQFPETQSTAAFAAFQSGETLMNQPEDKGLDAALEKYKQAIELDPHYAIAYAKLAQAYLHIYWVRREPGAIEVARGNAERALALDHTLIDGYLARALLMETTGDEQNALHDLETALSLDHSDPRVLFMQGQIYARLDRWSDAAMTFRRILRDRPNSWTTYNELGVALDKQGKFKDAIDAFRAATVIAPGSSLAFANLGGEYLETGDFVEATNSLKRSLALYPNDLAAANTSLALRYQGNYSEALPFARKAVQLNPTEPTNWLELGDCYSSLKNPSAALTAYRQAERETAQRLQTDTGNGPNWMLLALYRAKCGDSKDALALVQKAESLGAGDMDSQLYKARVMELLGKRSDALTTLEACFRHGATALQIAPFPDMESLRRDPRYLQIVRSTHNLGSRGE